MQYFNPVEIAEREELEALKLSRLQATVARLYEKVPFYRGKLDEAGVKPGDIKSLADLEKLPFTVKNDLRENYPFGLFAVPMRDIVRIHASSGTTGKSTVVGYTAEDIKTWSDLIARTIVAANGTPDDISRSPTDTGSSRAGWASTTAWRGWEPRWFPSLAATPNGRYV